ncbi:MAG: hypothetical protein KDD94_10040 [Calditrichaeota bacterium]|nr:hypothetical protein [Calditrichota bacterium]
MLKSGIFMLSLFTMISTQIVVDGTINQAEWSLYSNLKTDTVLIREDLDHIYIGIHSNGQCFANVFISIGDTIFIFHASGSIARATYVKTGDFYQLKQGFEFRLKDPSIEKSDKVYEDRQNEHYRLYNWLANTISIGNSSEIEYKLKKRKSKNNYEKIAVSYSINGFSEKSFPSVFITDPKQRQALLFGNTPEKIGIDPNKLKSLHQ